MSISGFRERRTALGLSVADLAELAGVEADILEAAECGCGLRMLEYRRVDDALCVLEARSPHESSRVEVTRDGDGPRLWWE